MSFLLSFLTLESVYQTLLQINKLHHQFSYRTVILRFCWSNSSIHDTALRSISSVIQHGNVSIRLTDVSALANNCNQRDQTLYNCFIVIAQNPGNLLYSPTLPLLNAERLVSKKTVISICGSQKIANYCGIIFSQEGSFRCIFKLHVPPLFSFQSSLHGLFLLFIQIGPCVFIRFEIVLFRINAETVNRHTRILLCVLVPSSVVCSASFYLIYFRQRDFLFSHLCVSSLQFLIFLISPVIHFPSPCHRVWVLPSSGPNQPSQKSLTVSDPHSS